MYVAFEVKLDGKHSSTARSALNELCNEFGSELTDILSGRKCFQCDSQLSRYSRLQQELQELKSKLTQQKYCILQL